MNVNTRIGSQVINVEMKNLVLSLFKQKDLNNFTK